MCLSYGRIIFPRIQGEKNNVKVKMLLLFKCVSFLVDNNNNFHHVVVDDDDKFQDQIQKIQIKSEFAYSLIDYTHQINK